MFLKELNSVLLYLLTLFKLSSLMTLRSIDNVTRDNSVEWFAQTSTNSLLIDCTQTNASTWNPVTIQLNNNSVPNKLTNVTNKSCDKQILNELNVKSLPEKILCISVHGIDELPHNLLTSFTNLRKLQVNNSQTTSLSSDLFLNTTNIEIISLIKFKNLTQLPPKFWTNLHNLKNVMIFDTAIKNIPEDLLWNSPNISSISLTRNKLIKLPKCLFRNCSHLKTLDLSQNQLETLDATIFKNLREIEVINLSDNQLRTLSYKTFENLFNLIDLILSQNKLINISDYTFKSSLRRLKFLNLSRNSINHTGSLAFKTLTNLEVIDLSRNIIQFENVEKSPFQYCKKLKRLNLAFNNINKIFEDWIPDSTSLPFLREVNLRNNNVETLPNSLFKIERPFQIDLRENRISIVEINEDLLRIEKSDVKILLNGNPIQCTCKNYELIRYLNLNMSEAMYNIVVDYALCQDTGVTNEKRSLAKVSCNFTENCPTNCECIFWPYNSLCKMTCPPSAQLKQLPSLPKAYDKKRIENFHLILKNNQIEIIPHYIPEGYDSLVTELDLSNNNLAEINAFPCSPKLQKLDLSKNNLNFINQDILDKILKSPMSNGSLVLHDNPWQCNSAVYEFITSQNDSILNSTNISCQSAKNIWVLLILPIGLVIFLVYRRFELDIKALMFTLQCFQSLMSKPDPEVDKSFDALVWFHENDSHFVLNTLVPSLNEDFLITHELRDFDPLGLIEEEIIRGITESKRIILVISESYVGEPLLVRKIQTALEYRSKFINIMYGEIPSTIKLGLTLNKCISRHSYITWGDTNFWKKLYFLMPHKLP